MTGSVAGPMLAGVGHRRRPLFVLLVVAALVLDACGAAPVSPAPSASSGTSASGVPAGAPSGGAPASPGGTAVSGPSGLPAGATEITDADLAPDPSPPIPEPILSDPLAIADALYDPAGVASGVVSALDLMGIAIVGGDGTVRHQPRGTPPVALSLTEDEVRGLIAMGSADARAIIPGMPGGSPYTFSDLYRALSPLLPGVSAADLASRYAGAYEAHPETLFGAIFGTQPIGPDLALTRAQLWLLLVDGFVRGEGSARGGPSRVILAASSSPGWGTAAAGLPVLVSPDPRLSATGFQLMLAHLPLLAYSIPFEAQPLVASAHEGHGGPGQTVPMSSHIGPGTGSTLVDPITGAPLFLPASPRQDGIPVRWTSNDASVMDEHGSLDRMLDIPIPTDISGDATLRYTPREEAANGRGDEVAAVANLAARVGMADLVTHFYDVSPIARGFLFGDRVTPGLLHIGWHEEAGLEISLENIHNVIIEQYIQAFLPGFTGQAHRTGVDSVKGFLARQPDGTYRGTLRAKVDLYSVHMKFASAACDFDGGSHVVASSAQWLQVVGRPVTSSSWDGFDLAEWGRVRSGSPDSEVVQLTFYPASSPRAWSVWCLTPVQYDDPERGPQGTYAPFNALNWTDPTVGYPIFTPSSGTLSYSDARGTLDPLRALALNQVDGSVWSVDVTRKGNAP